MVSYSGMALKAFGTLAAKYESSFEFLRSSFVKADIMLPLNVYVSIAFLTAFIAFVAGLSAAVFLGFFVLTDIAMRVMILMILPIIVPAVSFAILMGYPSFQANSRKKNIETNLPFVLTHMGSISESGIPPYIIFRLVGNFEEYGEITNEFKKIARSIDVYGVDPLTAIRSVAERSPSDTFKQMLMGFITTTESGGNIKLYLKSVGDQALFEWRTKREKFLEQLSAYAEMYTGLMVAAPLFIISLFVVMGMISPTLAGFDILDLTRLSIYVIVPAMNVGFLGFLRGVEVEI